VTVFLKAYLRDPASAWMLVNATSTVTLAGRVSAAVDSRSRRRGLLGRTSLDDEALIIAPCNAVHTFFMRFPIDVIFTDREGRITHLSKEVRPWRFAGALRGFAAIELPSGTIGRTGTSRGQRVELRRNG
jgi:uncharacterized membrane protein (UPF0127 family)